MWNAKNWGNTWMSLKNLNVVQNLLVVVIDEHKEEDEADEAGDEGQQAEEEALRGPDAVRLGVGRHLATRHAHPVVVLTVISKNLSLGVPP